MNKIYQVLVIYATRRLLMLIAFLITVAGMCMIYAADSGDRGSGSSDMRPILPLLFLIAIMNLFLGSFLKQQMATYRAALVPGYRTPHLIAVTLVVLFPLAVFTVTAAANSLPLPGIIGMFAFAAMAGLNAGNSSQWAFLPVFAILMATFLVPHIRAAVFEMLNGQQPGMAWSLISAALAGTALLFHRLATLTEDDPEFGKVMPMDPWDLRASAIRSQNRAMLQRNPWFSNLMAGPASRRLDMMTSRPATTIWQRVALLRMGDDAPINFWWFVIIMMMVEFMLVRVAPGSLPDRRQAFINALVVLTSISGFVQWTLMYRRWPRLGYESLRPQTRRQWVVENALANITNAVCLQSAMLILNVIVFVVFLRGTVSVPLIVNALLLFVGSQTLIFGLSSWLASFGSSALYIMAAGGFLGLLISSSTAVLKLSQSDVGHGGILSLASGCVTFIVGVCLCGMAYRRWCRIDFA